MIRNRAAVKKIKNGLSALCRLAHKYPKINLPIAREMALLAFVKKKILDVGQCGFDHRSIKSALESMGAEVIRARADEALALLGSDRYALVLVNRLLDPDNASGIDLIRSIKARPEFAAIPVMLVSDLPEAQSTACEAGAVPGFGKRGLHLDETRTLLAKYIGNAESGASGAGSV